MQLQTTPPAHTGRVGEHLAPFAPLFHAAENARTAAWRALERGDLVAAALACQTAAAAFTRAAELAERGGG